MKQRFPKSMVSDPLAILRKAGYFHFVDPITKEESYVLRLSAERYPRLHLYVEEHGSDWSFNLHLDQKKASYKGSNKHAGEYEGPVVEREMQRLMQWIEKETGYKTLDPEKPFPPPGDARPSDTQYPEQKTDLFGGIF